MPDSPGATTPSLSVGVGPLLFPTLVTAGLAIRGTIIAASAMLIVGLLLALRGKHDRVTGPALVAAYLMIGSLGGPMAGLMPATLVSAAPVETLPSDWLSSRNRWEAFHAARTFISPAGFGSPLAAALWSSEDATPPV